ncbi:hypothetical protein FB451DRAFT_1178668 [Mycena latifolia]|nr:hypothetical protein FB451DRAFT_1178668 [Mycena latifolia]
MNGLPDMIKIPDGPEKLSLSPPPSLLVSSLVNFQLLPQRKSTGSLRSIVGNVGKQLKFPDAESRLLLAALYPNLDPVRISAVADLNTANEFTAESCHCAVLAMTAIAHMVERGEPFSSDMAREFWPGISSWIFFFHRHKDAIPVLLTMDIDMYTIYVVVIACIRRHANDLVEATPGVEIILTAAWKYLLTLRASKEIQEGTYSQLHRLVFHLMTRRDTGRRSGDPLDLEEVIEGAGGTLSDLVSLLKLHLQCALLRPQSRVSGQILFQMFIVGTWFMRTMHDGDGPGNMALVSQGIIKAEVTSLCSFATFVPSPPYTDAIEGICLPGFLDRLEVTPGYPYVRQALKAGLLRIIILRGQRPDVLLDHYKELLTKILPRSMIYHSVLSQLQQSLLEVEELQSSSTFRESDLFANWTSFISLAQDRLAVMNDYDSKRHESREMCFHIEEAYYCTDDCQCADWRAGRHSALCRVIKSCPLRKCLSARDTSFLRALVHSDYVRKRDIVLLKQILGMHKNPLDISMPLFSYTDPGEPGPVAFDIASIPRSTAQPFVRNDTRPSGAGIETQGVNVFLGRTSAIMIVPMRISSTEARHKLRCIAREMPEGMDASHLNDLSPDLWKRIGVQVLVRELSGFFHNSDGRFAYSGVSTSFNPQFVQSASSSAVGFQICGAPDKHRTLRFSEFSGLDDPSGYSSEGYVFAGVNRSAQEGAGVGDIGDMAYASWRVQLNI